MITLSPIYVINLLISDLIQFCCMIVEVAAKPEDDMITFMYYFGLMASVDFMVCDALERYLAISCPLWYRFRQNIKIPIALQTGRGVISSMGHTWVRCAMHKDQSSSQSI
ncbi:G-protein coupled receptor 4-like protein [Lates japonicus]|uniref:G-protein coupled receptor 4-like protein n=1 Tax=Lates japonicus TaxID=270547 RepID=A0AAD3NC81_LATJO|nr:G-protein coupled receptor 4-like protein [Lates japonicus]